VDITVEVAVRRDDVDNKPYVKKVPHMALVVIRHASQRVAYPNVRKCGSTRHS
jgi:hypothetical protein